MDTSLRKINAVVKRVSRTAHEDLRAMQRLIVERVAPVEVRCREAVVLCPRLYVLRASLCHGDYDDTA